MNLAAYIDNEVQKFINNDRLTEDNLKKLDDKICKEAFSREKRDALLNDDKRSTVSSHRNSMAEPPRSAIPRDRLSQTMEMPLIKKDASERQSVTSAANLRPQANRRLLSLGSDTQSEEVFSQVGKTGKVQDDEWNAIVKFNTLLHYEEQKR